MVPLAGIGTVCGGGVPSVICSIALVYFRLPCVAGCMRLINRKSTGAWGAVVYSDCGRVASRQAAVTAVTEAVARGPCLCLCLCLYCLCVHHRCLMLRCVRTLASSTSCGCTRDAAACIAGWRTRGEWSAAGQCTPVSACLSRIAAAAVPACVATSRVQKPNVHQQAPQDAAAALPGWQHQNFRSSIVLHQARSCSRGRAP